MAKSFTESGSLQTIFNFEVLTTAIFCAQNFSIKAIALIKFLRDFLAGSLKNSLTKEKYGGFFNKMASVTKKCEKSNT